MYAIIEQGSKQYKVTQGDVITIELTDVCAKVVASFEKTAADAVVKGKKLYPMHFRKRKDSKRRIGHRQKYLQITIDKIEA
jgi:large subunit ribosomal protein L21